MKFFQIGLASTFLVLSSSLLTAQSSNAKTAGDSTHTPQLCDFIELDVRPEPIKRVQPLYPAELKAAHKSGDALISFIIDIDGSVKNPTIEKASEPAFGEAALAAVSAWTFKPGYKNGTPVPCRLSLPIVFALEK